MARQYIDRPPRIVGDDPVNAEAPEFDQPAGVVHRPHVHREAQVRSHGHEHLVHHEIVGVNGPVPGLGSPPKTPSGITTIEEVVKETIFEE